MIMKYDPDTGVEPTGWLELDEAERLDLVLEYHRRARVKLPNLRMHATIHAIVEYQIAMGDEFPAARTVERLQAEGLDRHEAIHAVGSVVAEQIYDLVKKGIPAGDPNTLYSVKLERLTAETWRRGG